jgi:hypothetical protein
MANSGKEFIDHGINGKVQYSKAQRRAVFSKLGTRSALLI